MLFIEHSCTLLNQSFLCCFHQQPWEPDQEIFHFTGFQRTFGPIKLRSGLDKLSVFIFELCEHLLVLGAILSEIELFKLELARELLLGVAH